MAASIETAGVVSALKGMLRRAGLARSRPVAHLSGRALVTTADVALTQMGVPAALACCQYLAVRWRSCPRRQNGQQRTPNLPCDVGPAPDTATRDHERR
jgi:hypothetical protein